MKMKTMLKRIPVFVFVYIIFSINIALAAEIRSKIKNVSITGLFEDSDGKAFVVTEHLLPADGKIHKVRFTNDTTEYSIPFIAKIIRTISKNSGKYFIDEIKIEYSSLAKTDFYRNGALLRFLVYDEEEDILLIEKVIDYRKADPESPGWILNTDKLPAYEVIFDTKDYSVNKGATNWAWFIIQYSYVAPE